jgi:hypothetical protein
MDWLTGWLTGWLGIMDTDERERERDLLNYLWEENKQSGVEFVIF